MKKKRSGSSFQRLFNFSMAIIALCILLLSVFITAFSTKLFKTERYSSISSASDVFISRFLDEYSVSGNIYSDNVLKLYNSFMNKYEIKLYLYDRDGNCMLSPEQSDNAPLSKDTIKMIDNGKVFDIGADSVSESEPMLVYGDRFSVSQNYSDERTRFYLTAYGSPDEINAFTVKIVIFLCIISAAILAAAGFVMKKYYKKYRIASDDFLRVSEKYSKGDFSERLDIKIGGNIREVSKYINVLADYAANSEETSKVFIANVSHELRTPITTIGGFVSGILDGTIPKSKSHEYLYLVSNEIKRLSILINSMLNMSRFESGTLKPNFTETNLTELVIQTVLMFEKKIEEKNVEIIGLDSDRLTAVADANLIQQVIYNLVENAVKFVNSGGTISFSFEKNNEGICIIAIRNTGEGLKNDEIQKVFNRFYKTDASRGKDKTGLGLGLSISRKIVHLHNGHIVVKSVYGEYTEFSIQIPEKQD